MGDTIEGPQDLPVLKPHEDVPKDLGERYGETILKADGFAEVFPEHKFLIVEALRQSGFAVGMTGDGVNDAPALKRGDVGIAVSGATDAARAAADIVLTQPGLSVVIHALRLSRVIFGRMKSFLTYRISATVQLLFFFSVAVFAFDPKSYYACGRVGLEDRSEACARHLESVPDFFSLPVVMLMLITLLNDGCLISIGYDHVNPSRRPEKWRLRALFAISAAMGAVACASSLLLLYLGLDSWNPDGLFHSIGAGDLSYGKVVTMMYLKISVSDFLTLFSSRQHEGFFWSSRPHWALLTGASLALTLSTVLSLAWPEGETDGIPAMGMAIGGEGYLALYVWIYCLAFWMVQDAAKVGLHKLMVRHNIFDINTAQLVNLRAADNLRDTRRPLARASVGMVEGKLLGNRAAEALERLSKRLEKDPELARLSGRMRAARTSLQLRGRPSAGSVSRSSAAVVSEVRQLAQQALQRSSGGDGRSAPSALSASEEAATSQLLSHIIDTAAEIEEIHAVMGTLEDAGPSGFDAV